MTAPSLHFPGMFVIQGPYVVDFSDIPHNGNAKVLWTPSTGDILVGLWGDCRTSVVGATAGGAFNSAGLELGNAVTPDLYAPGQTFDFNRFLPSTAAFSLPYVITSVSPIRITYN